MAAKVPIRAVFDGSTATGLAEFQSTEFIALAYGGLGASLSIGSAGQVIKVNSAADAMEFGAVEAVLNIDGMTDGSGITIAASDKFAVSDGGTEKYVLASQIKTYAGSPALDDLSTGDAASTLQTSSGAITIDSNAAAVTVDGHTGVTLQSTNSGNILLDSVADIVLDAGGADVTLKDDGTVYGSLTQSGGELLIKSGSTPTTALTLAGANATLAGTLGVGAITGTSTIQGTTITATTAFVPDASDGAALGTAALEFSDLFLADSAVLNFGDDQDTTLTHTDGTGLTLNSTNKLCFNDVSQFVQGISATVLGLGATDEIDLTATAIDINGTCDISGTFSLGGTTVGSTAAELTLLDGSAKSTSSITVIDADALIIIDGTTTKQIPASDMKTYIGGGTSWQAVKTANFTAAAGQGVFCNTTSSAFTITLPAGTIGDEVSIIDYAGTFDSYNLTVAANGSEKIHGSTDDLTVATERAAFTLVFTDGTQGWLLTNN